MKILHSNIIGKGKPVLILHGFLGMGDNWKSHANSLAEDGFEVHLIDQRNHGRSFHADDFNYKLLVADLQHYILQHNIKNPHILGHSMGGKTAMLFAVENPILVDKLIVADIAPKEYPAHHNAILKALNSVDFTIQNSRKLVDAKLAEFIPEFGVRQFLAKSLYWKEKGQLAFRFNLPSLNKNYEEVIVSLPNNKQFLKPTLFLRGSKSGYILNEDAPLLKAHFPNSKINTVDNAGHWLHAENPKDFNKKLISFLTL